MKGRTELSRKDLLYPDLSYAIIGAAFDVFNSLGYGHREVYYQQAFAIALRKNGLDFIREKQVSLQYEGAPIGKCILDFIVNDLIVVELKVAPRLGYTQVKQAVAYLAATGLNLALLIWFTKDGVKYRRVLRPLANHS